MRRSLYFMCWLVSKEMRARSMSFLSVCVCGGGHIFEHSCWFVTEITPLLTPPHPSQVLHSCQINTSIPERTASHRERDPAAPYIQTPWIPHRYGDDYHISVFNIHQMPNIRTVFGWCVLVGLLLLLFSYFILRFAFTTSLKMSRWNWFC